MSKPFRFIETSQGGQPWGRLLDAGTGVHSSRWAMGLATRSWTAVTGAPSHADQVRRAVGEGLRPQDRLVVGNWMDEALLAGESFDTVLADYLLGAVEGFAPFFQPYLFRRLRPLVCGRLYVVGLDPYVVGEAFTPAGKVVQSIGRLRDACLWLADEVPYREYPAEWVVDRLKEAGFTVVAAERFAIRYERRWIDSQLGMTLHRLPKLADRRLAAALEARVEALRQQAYALCDAENGLRHGFDYVIAAEPANGTEARG